MAFADGPPGRPEKPSFGGRSGRDGRWAARGAPGDEFLAGCVARV